MNNQPEIQQFELLWLQAIPSISAIYYHKYLSETHVLHYLDDPHNDSQVTPRSIGKEIHKVIQSNEKRVAICFWRPCSQVRRNDIFKFILKHKPDLSAYCLTIPSTILQSHLLLGWSAGLDNIEWKRRCVIHSSPEAFLENFLPPTKESGQSNWPEFSQSFVISNELFQKQALIVNLRDEMMVSFDMEQGLVFTEAAKNSILGWTDASTDQTRTLIYIIDERTLYRDIVYNVPQERRDQLLRKLRGIIFESLQEFNDTMPSYSYIADYFDTDQFNLLNCLSQIQHRHYICISQSIFLGWSNDDGIDLNHDYFANMRCLYLNYKGTLQRSKWMSLYQTYIKEQTEASKRDKLNYISSQTIGITVPIEQYRTPLLSTSNTGDLTKVEFFNHSIRHCVSAKSLDIFDIWANNVMKMASKPCPPPSSFDTSPSQSSGTEEIEESLSQSAIDTTGSPMERIIASLTLEAIETYINNKGFMDRAQSMLTGIQDPLIFIDSSEQSIEISGKVQSSSANTCAVTISLEKSADEHYELLQGHCPCLLGKTQGKCKHCGALLLYIQSNPTNINMETGDLLQRKQAYYSRTGMSSVQHERGYSSQDSQASSSKKRSYNSSLEEEGNTSESSSKKRSSHSQQSSVSTVAYDPHEISSASTVTYDSREVSSASTVAYDPNSMSSSAPSLGTDEETRARPRITRGSPPSPPQVPVDIVTPSPVASNPSTRNSKSHSSQSQSNKSHSSQSQSSKSHSSQSQSSGLITLPSLPSSFSSHSGSLSDTISVRASLNIIVENTVQEEEEVQRQNNDDDDVPTSQPVLGDNSQSTSHSSNREPVARGATPEDLVDTLPADTTDDESFDS